MRQWHCVNRLQLVVQIIKTKYSLYIMRHVLAAPVITDNETSILPSLNYNSAELTSSAATLGVLLSDVNTSVRRV